MIEFKAIGIWALNPKVIDHRTRQGDAYTIKFVSISYEDNGNGTINENYQGGEDGATTQLMNIIVIC